uniref:Rac GTPase-activating protein 1 n=1 Tax=Oryzias sinensis TaxID=183150 RepID=A0A8C7ZGU3_9TELE
MESSVMNLNNQFQSLRAQVEALNESVEPQFLQMAVHFEECRKKWLLVGDELGSCKEMLAKAETERGALEVRLKHARNQVDVEIRRRQKAEAVYEKLERQLQLIRDLLVSENNGSSVHLSEEQRSALAFLSAHSLTRIEESGSLLSDISYDQTDESLDWDSSAMKNVRLRKRPKRVTPRHHSLRSLDDVKHYFCVLQVNESIVAKTTITTNGGVVEAVSTIEAVPYWTQPVNLTRFLIPALQVIKSEFCGPCGRRTKFGKLYLRCQDCRVVAHPECRDLCPLPCNPPAVATPIRNTEATLADFAPATPPMIPPLILYCIKEIERRGLHEVGLYRVSGHERAVKELKEKLVRGKTLPSLNKVEDINVVAGVLKDFLRNLPEPLLTFRLNKVFMEAAEIQDDGNCLAMLYQTISELPQPNRDTLAFLVIHLHKVARSVDTKMDIQNLARVFGPTLVGHAVPDPDPMTILHDTSRQPKVVELLMSIPESYWRRFAYPDVADMDSSHQPDSPKHKVSILGPVTTPEHQTITKTPSSGSLSQRMMQTLSSTSFFGSKSKATSAPHRQGNFFTSPQLK